MHLSRRLPGLAGVVVLAALAQPASAQLVSLSDDLALFSRLLHGEEEVRRHRHLGPGPGSLESLFPTIPGQPGPATLEPRTRTPGQAYISAVPEMAYATRIETDGAVELPAVTEEGPPDGLTLEQALDRLVQHNYDLRTRFQELSKADADILTAGLRSNPLLFVSVSNIPYGSYSPQRPGEVIYGGTIIQAIDLNNKRQRRLRVARSARNVLQALYQNAVRQQIDNLYKAFLDVLAQREILHHRQSGLAALEADVAHLGGPAARENEQVLIRRDTTALGVESAAAALRQAQQTLAALLNLPAEEASCLQVHGRLETADVALPCVEELIDLALQQRPDLAAYRLGILRAQAELGLARSERMQDAFLLYTPWQLQDNSALGLRNASSWSLGGMVTLPLFNRNEGNIARARVAVSQTALELQSREREVVSQVQQAYQEYQMTHAAVARLQQEILPRARRIRDHHRQQVQSGKGSASAYLDAQKDYEEIVHQYLEALIHHRRSGFHLNTVVAERLIP